MKIEEKILHEELDKMKSLSKEKYSQLPEEERIKYAGALGRLTGKAVGIAIDRALQPEIQLQIKKQRRSERISLIFSCAVLVVGVVIYFWTK